MTTHLTTAELIKQNHKAPADTIIRSLFQSGLILADGGDDDNDIFADITECLEMWYGVDELTILIRYPENKDEEGPFDTFITLAHQERMDKPTIEDICDYGTSLEKYPAVARAMDEDNYAQAYRF